MTFLAGVFSFNGLNNFIQSGFGWLAYNRDNYSANVAMRQSQLYQEKNYHISWIAIARDDVRDIMQTSVGRLNNYLIVTTLIFGVAVTAILEGEVPPEAEKFVRTACYANYTISLVYFVLSIMFGVTGSKEAYDCSLDLLTAELRPDTPDPYDFNYMRQCQQFEKGGLTKGFRIPVVGAYWSATKQTMAKLRSKEFAQKKLLEELHKPAIHGPAPLPTQFASKGVQSAMRTSTPSDGEPGERDTAWYFARFRSFQDLWQPYEDAARRCMGYGMVALSHASAYYIMGKLNQRDELWVSITLFLLFVYLATLLFISSFEVDKYDGMSSNSAYSEAILNEKRTFKQDAWESRTVTTLAFVSLVFGPLCCAAAARVHSMYSDSDLVARIAVPVCFAAHMMLAILCFMKDHLQVLEREKEEAARNQNIDSSAMRSRHGLFRRMVFKSDQNSNEGSINGNGDSQPQDCKADREAAGFDGLSKGSSSNDTPDREDQGVPHVQRRDDEWEFDQEVERYRSKINEAFLLAFGQSRLAHVFAALTWLSVCIESLFSVSFAKNYETSTISDIGQARMLRGNSTDARRLELSPAAVAEELSVEWPSELFQPRALACSDSGVVFVADEFRVFRLQAGGSLQPVACDLDGYVADLGAACRPGGDCWPTVLVTDLSGDGPSQVVDCDVGIPLPLLQTQRRAERMASVSATALLAMQVGGRMLEYRESPTRAGWQPLWEAAKVEESGLVAADVSSGDLITFWAPSCAGVSGRIEARSLRSPRAVRKAWELPPELPAPVAGCAINGSAALILTSSVDEVPQIFRLNIPP